MDEYIAQEKFIYKIPAPYSLENTPYYRTDFSEKTRKRCFKEGNGQKITKEWLKISKVVIIGDVSVGKTCLVNRYCKKFFDSNYKSTIGVDFEIEQFCILGVPFILQVWDTAGQERFKSIAQSYYRGANVLILVFDLTNCNSLSNCKKWLSEAQKANLGTDPFIFLVGAKKDLVVMATANNLVEILTLTLQSNIAYKNIKNSAFKVAKELNAEYWSVSSKTGENVNKLFCRIASLTFEEVMNKCDKRKSAIFIGEKLIDDRKKKSKDKSKMCCNQ